MRNANSVIELMLRVMTGARAMVRVRFYFEIVFAQFFAIFA